MKPELAAVSKVDNSVESFARSHYEVSCEVALNEQVRITILLRDTIESWEAWATVTYMQWASAGIVLLNVLVDVPGCVGHHD